MGVLGWACRIGPDKKNGAVRGEGGPVRRTTQNLDLDLDLDLECILEI